jgi:hypothetical protein
VSALAVNRLFSNFAAGEPPAGEALAAAPSGDGSGTAEDPRAYGELTRNLQDFLAVSSREERYVEELAEEVAPAPVVRVPFLKEDVHDLEGLEIVASHLLN